VNGQSLAAALRVVLEDPAVRPRAEALGQTVGAERGDEVAATHIEQLVKR
jgi:UDP:flavonoid glycosyltransferase YjiC (YdhE family)